ncbi:hypothetical protein CEW89_18435 [Celeribacter ethanolicus]|uniref:Uncharacterized protein n=2 Tax=Celeribacter ethanolicus TaxID=1758178 RepID=A0A291GGS0_9RHOB|nr:hypothetical protein CEW89_18435 [Celeribacter ethanolicus]
MPPQPNGHSLCISLSCDEVQGWMLQMEVGGARPPDHLPTFLTVDGQEFGDVGFSRVEDQPGLRRYSALLDQPLHPGMRAALEHGRMARFTAVIGETGYAYDLPLIGAQAAIGQVASACNLPPAHIAARIAAQKAEEARNCHTAVQFDGVFGKIVDLNQDGFPDLDFDYGAVRCGPSRMYCGSGGCSHTLLIGRPDGSFVTLVDQALLRGYSTPVPGYIDFDLHGSFCGKVGAERCAKRHRIEVGSGYARLGPEQIVAK